MKFFHVEHEAKTVMIPVRVVNGKITYFYGGSMPKLKDGAMGDLPLLESDVLDAEWVAPLREARTIRILEVGAVIMLAMRLNRIPGELKKETITFTEAKVGRHIGVASVRAMTAETMNYRFVPTVLTEPLDLIVRGTKKAVLEGGACLLPTLEVGATSLNHAYSLASAKYEPDRRSHKGNVFQRTYYCSPVKKIWWSLEGFSATT